MSQPFDNRDWDQRQIAEKDAEIERLKAVIEDLSDHGCAAERMERLKAQSAEIEQLKILLTRAADALDRVAPYVEQHLIVELRRAAQ